MKNKPSLGVPMSLALCGLSSLLFILNSELVPRGFAMVGLLAVIPMFVSAVGGRILQKRGSRGKRTILLPPLLPVIVFFLLAGITMLGFYFRSAAEFAEGFRQWKESLGPLHPSFQTAERMANDPEEARWLAVLGKLFVTVIGAPIQFGFGVLGAWLGSRHKKTI